jgi:ParB-like chromosome segregation protein Spo0J
MSDPIDQAVARNPLFASRVVRFAEEAPDQLLAHPLNWRVHPGRQEAILRDTIRQVGWVVPVIVNEQTGHVLDGHLRVAFALRENIPTVPVVYVDVSPVEEQTILMTIDPLAALALPDTTKLKELLDEARVDGDAIVDFFASLRAGTERAIARAGKVVTFETHDGPVETSYRCPKCAYEWSGQPRPGV